jgi:penicillin V acylase-like amidase (Ntn superfamily)
MKTYLSQGRLTPMWKVILTIIITAKALACSSFSARVDGDRLMAKGFDWHFGNGHLMIRPKGLKKKALLSDLNWKSKYNSITFNLFGPDMPIGGMNEKGVAIEALLLPQSKYPSLGEKNVNEGTWIQYQLDQYSSVDEIIKNINKLNIQKVYRGAHFYICDPSECAVIEFLDHKALFYRGSDFPVEALTNAPYDKLVKNIAGDYPQYDIAGSQKRFNLIRENLDQVKGPEDLYQVLNLVKLGHMTQWQIGYNLTQRQIHLKTKLRNLTRIKFSNLNFSCKKDILGLNLVNKNRFKKIDIEDIKKRIQKLDIHPKIKQVLLQSTMTDNC